MTCLYDIPLKMPDLKTSDNIMKKQLRIKFQGVTLNENVS